MRASLAVFLAAALCVVTLALAGEGSNGGPTALRRRHHRSLALKRQVEEQEAAAGVQKRASVFHYGGKSLGADTVRGVALGGWLVLENFITPSVFTATGNDAVVDEWTFGSLISKTKGQRILQSHLDSFVSEDDFRQIAAAGLNHVRVPIGFWAFDVQGQEPYLKLNQWDLMKQAALWCAKYDLKMWVDLHGVPGSQNGFDHSGRLGGSHFASKQSYIDRTLAIIETMAQEFAKAKYANTVTMIEMINEPLGVDTKTLKTFYRNSYDRIRKHSQDIVVVLSDKFVDPSNGAWDSMWKDFMGSGYDRIAMDTHIYTIFDDNSIRMNADARQQVYCSKGPSFEKANKIKWEFTGEFTPAFTDCAHALNGRNKGARYDGSLAGSRGFYKSCKSKVGPASGFSDGYKALLARFFQVQKETYERGAGWIMWTWKTEAGTGEDWSYSAGLGKWIPRNLDTSLSSYHC